jgi:hypothetical protein
VQVEREWAHIEPVRHDLLAAELPDDKVTNRRIACGRHRELAGKGCC